jgi:hypothetical protein
MTPQEATQWLEQKTAEFVARRTAPVPSREAIEDAYDAQVRLSALVNDPTWARRFSEGSFAERQEYQELQEIIAAGADESGMSVRVGDAEVVEGPHGIRRSDLFGALSDLNRVGIPVQGLERILDGNFSDEDVAWAQQSLDRAMATPAWREALVSGDPTARHEMTAWSAVISSRKTL